MDINKLNNINNSNLKKTDGASKGQKSEDTSSSKTADSTADKVSISDYQFRNNDQLFAKLELEKLNNSASDQLKEMKARISEFNQAAEAPDKTARETEIGQKINDPAVWEDIAHKILS